MRADRINYYESHQESEYPTWRKGKSKRDILLKLYKEDPAIPLEQAASILEISKQQVVRHRRTLICEGLLTVGVLLFFAVNSAYYVSCEDREAIDQWIEDHIKSPTFELVEDVKWEYNL